MKKRIKSILGIGMAAIMTFCLPVGIYADAKAVGKEENIYAILDYNGEVNQVYAVNAFEVSEEKIITDYGNYDSIRNMTTIEELELKEDQITINAPVGRFYYQGNSISRELPWNIEIEYKLDGNVTKPTDLIGKSGEVELTIQVAKNEQVNEAFFEHYSLQISLSLDGNKFNNIIAQGATMANAGNNKSITFTHLPGTEKNYIIKAEVTDFSLAPIQFNGVTLSMDIELEGVDSMTQDLTKLTEGIGELKSGTTKLKEGSKEFNQGLEVFADNSNPIKSSSKEINSAISASAGGLEELLQSTQQLKELANMLIESQDPQVQGLASGYLTQVAAIEQIAGGLSALSNQYGQFDKGVTQITEGIKTLEEGYQELDNGIIELSKGVDEMQESTAHMDTEIENKMDEMLAEFTNKDFQPISFLSEKNTEVSSVQFVIRTNALELKEITEPVEPVKESLNFWQKLLKLFGFYKED